MNFRQFCHVGESDRRLQTWFTPGWFICRRLAKFKIKRQEVYCAYSDHTRLFQYYGCARSKPQFLTAVQSLKLCRLTQALRMNGFTSSSICRTCLGNFIRCKPAKGNLERHKRERVIPSHSHSDDGVFELIDHVPINVPNSSHWTELYPVEDSAAVIQIITKDGASQERTESICIGCLRERMWILLVWIKTGANKRSLGGYFDTGNVQGSAVAFSVDFVANQTTL